MDQPKGPGTVLVVAAMPVELKPLSRLLDLKRDTLGGMAIRRGMVHQVRVIGAVIGIGPAESTRSTERLLQAVATGTAASGAVTSETATAAAAAAATVNRVVMIGIAGGLEPSLQIGDLVIPETVIDGATMTEYRPQPLQGGTPNGKLLTNDEIASDPSYFDRCRQQGVVALDMETAAVGAVAERHGIPWSAFRAISDRVQDGIVDAATLALTKPDGSADVKAAMKLMARRPGVVPKLIKLARDTDKAVRVAAEAGARECQAFATSAAR